jgi:hypothetical protein
MEEILGLEIALIALKKDKTIQNTPQNSLKERNAHTHQQQSE